MTDSNISFVTEEHGDRRCLICLRCASRGCPTTRGWSEEDWAEYEISLACPRCKADRINAALDANDHKNATRDWDLGRNN